MDAVASEHGGSEYGHVDSTEETALHIACSTDDSNTALQLVKLLLEHEAIVDTPKKWVKNTKDPTIVSPTTDPRDDGYVSNVVRKRVEETALHIAVMNDHVEVVKLLVAAGADVNIKRNHGPAEETSVWDLCKGPATKAALGPEEERPKGN